MRKLLAILCRYMNYRDPEMLLQIITLFCAPPLQQRMREYCMRVEAFEKATTVEVFKRVISAEEWLEEASSRVVLMNTNLKSNCTLYEFRKLEEKITEEASLHSHSESVQ